MVEYVRKLERRQVAAEKSIAVKTNHIKALEARVETYVSQVIEYSSDHHEVY